jgi:hypothetical protein
MYLNSNVLDVIFNSIIDIDSIITDNKIEFNPTTRVYKIRIKTISGKYYIVKIHAALLHLVTSGNSIQATRFNHNGKAKTIKLNFVA